MVCNNLVLISADWHVRHNNRIWESRSKIKDDHVIALHYVVKHLQQLRPKALILAGDIFDDRYVTSYSIDLLNTIITVCKEQGTKLLYIQGQHELSNPPLLSSIDDYCIHLHESTYDAGFAMIYGMDYQRAPSFLEPMGDVLITHQVWKDLMPYGGSAELSDPNLPELIISGDYHKHLILERHGRRLVSPGPLVPMAIDQIEPKVLVSLHPGGKIMTHDIPQRMIFTVMLEANQIPEKVASAISCDDTLPEQIRTPICILEYDPSHFSKSDLQPFYDRFHVIERPRSQEPVALDPADHDLISIPEALLHVTKDVEIAQLALRCYNEGIDILDAMFTD